MLRHIEQFLLELGAGFAFFGRQYRLDVGGEEFFVDLLFYHLQLRCYVVIDLKVTLFTPAQAEKRLAFRRQQREVAEWDWRRERDEARWYDEHARELRRQADIGLPFDFDSYREVVRKHSAADQMRTATRFQELSQSVASP